MIRKGGQFIRVATFNVALARAHQGALINELKTPDSLQVQRIAEIIQRVAPDVLLVQEFDYDADGQALKLFNQHYLTQSQNGQPALDYPYQYAVPSNTGVPSGHDFNADGRSEGPYDAFGFGNFAGQYAFAVLSRYPLLLDQQRSFQHFLWRDMPEAILPTALGQPTRPLFNDELLSIFRLSSKNHLDLPVELPDGILHLLAAHPTPPLTGTRYHVNSCRNHDEIRLWHDYLLPEKAGYLYDDQGQSGGLAATESAVIMGDLNADPQFGDGLRDGIQGLLSHPRLHQEAAQGRFLPSSLGGRDNALRQRDRRNANLPNAAQHTASWGLRVDYLLPTADLSVRSGGIFWPPARHPDAYLVENNASSDHRLLWLDIALPSMQ